ncbi:hypothetical protein LPB41_03885 [Thalassospira sp. MA62]|nr:hypothetical protein [Thalassospira sp. MA62]
MTSSDFDRKEPQPGPFMPGPKPAAPIPQLDAQAHDALRAQLSKSTAVTPPTTSPTGVPTDQTDLIDTVRIKGIDGNINRKNATATARLVDADPGQALRVIRNWLFEGRGN